MAKALLSIGLPGSGKSTYARCLQNNSCNGLYIINRDSLRIMVCGGVYNWDTSYESVIKDMALSCAYAALSADFDVFIDETNLTLATRAYWVSNLAKAGYPVTFIYFPENGKNLDYRMLDARGYSREYWKEVIDNMRKGFVLPAADCLEGNVDMITVTDPARDIL